MVVGYTHASNVIPLVNCSEAALLMVTSALVPLKLKALPYLPDAVQVAPLIVPLLPLPDTSVTIAPLPSLNPYAATKPGLGVGRSEEHTSELQSQSNLVCRLLLEKKKTNAPERSPPRAQCMAPRGARPSRPEAGCPIAGPAGRGCCRSCPAVWHVWVQRPRDARLP